MIDKIKKILYFCLNIVIIGWSILWLSMALIGGLLLKTFKDWFLTVPFFIVLWILGLLVLLLIRRIVRGKNNFRELKINKKFILIGILFFVLFSVIWPFLLEKAPAGYERFYSCVTFIVLILVIYLLFGKTIDKQIDKIKTRGNLQVLRPSKRLGEIFVVMFFFIILLLSYFEPFLADKRIVMFLVPTLFLITFIISIFLLRKRLELNCPYCSKLIQINIADKPPQILTCFHCKKKIQIKPYESEERLICLSFRKVKFPCPNCKHTIVLPRVIKKRKVFCNNCGKETPTDIIPPMRYVGVKTSDNSG